MEIEDLERDYASAMADVRKFHTPKMDARASAAYQRIVQAGAAPVLRAKYRSAQSSKYAGGERAADKKHRNKIGRDAHVKRFGEAPSTMLVVDGRTGKSVMVVG